MLGRMWQAGDMRACLTGGPNAESKDECEEALEGVQCTVLVMPSRMDQYSPPEDCEIKVKHLKRGKLGVIGTIWGHIAGAGANPVDTEILGEIDAKRLRCIAKLDTTPVPCFFQEKHRTQTYTQLCTSAARMTHTWHINSSKPKRNFAVIMRICGSVFRSQRVMRWCHGSLLSCQSSLLCRRFPSCHRVPISRHLLKRS